MRLPRLQWLDRREILPTDRPVEPFDPHPDDLRSAYFHFTVFRIMSIPPPPKPDKVLIPDIISHSTIFSNYHALGTQ